MLKTLIEAFALISTWEVIVAMFAASVYGLVIGSLPGLSATMATALLVPVTFYLVAHRRHRHHRGGLLDGDLFR